VPPPPDWLTEVPLVGERATKAWDQLLTSAGVRDLAPKPTRLTPWPVQSCPAAVIADAV
jgi:hypothetical protein